MNEPMYLRFENIVADIFTQHDFSVSRSAVWKNSASSAAYEADIILSWPKDADNPVRTVVEVKAYRTRSPSIRDLRNADNQARAAQASLNAEHRMVVVNCLASQLPRLDGRLDGALVVTLDDLFQLAEGDLGLIEALTELDRELRSSLRDFDGVTDVVEAKNTHVLEMIQAAPSWSSDAIATADETLELMGKGNELAKELESLPTGRDKYDHPRFGQKPAWRIFEQICEEAIQYVFEDHLHGWRPQEVVGEEADRFDVLAKVKGDDVFSRMLVQDFRSRFVLFEFKNYDDKLKQNLVYITEKYLFPNALRSTAIIISPKGLSSPAQAAARGALRDADKLDTRKNRLNEGRVALMAQ